MNRVTLHRLIVPTLPFFLVAACTTPQAFYSSPFNGNNGDYQTIPLVSDSVRSATYASIALWSGNANTHGHDYYNAFHMGISRSHNLGVIQAWYGATVTWGGFTLGHWDTTGASNNSSGINFGPHPVKAVNYLNSLVGTYYFGGEGFNGGMNAVMPFDGGEWRFIGFETSLNHEIGNYLTVRQNMPDTVATLDVRSDFFGTLGLTTELVRKTNTGQFGWRWGVGWAMGRNYNFLNIADNGTHVGGYGYIDFAFHWTLHRYTGFFLINTATKANAFHLGFNIRL
ncbi:MAG: hypothetical protein Q8927_16180 [Bacteroidota bacterium]|nr:hypothetical protein [Bacteroidota bacterium]MDP4246999.1 hypothetical protein [Bacteroidota bacterium]MDP4260084.1 hypothetical protein [Bacteroidota bacterium]